MKIHEYQAKELLKKFGVGVPFGIPIFNSESAGKAAFIEFESQGKKIAILKAQAHTGGRGKGIFHKASTGEEIEIDGKQVRGVNILTGENLADRVYRYANSMLGNRLVTVQTGAKGCIINKLLIEEGIEIEKEFYLSITLDRNLSRNTIIASTEGGMEIEKVAEESPELIIKEAIPARGGLNNFQARNLGIKLGFLGDSLKNFVVFLKQLVNAYDSLDCSLLEINPLVLTKDKRIIALDAKIIIDDNGLSRHAQLLELKDEGEEEPLEVEAAKFNLNYIKLDGNVGCMVNGAGLAMATMDMIKHVGGSPANFLDIGGGANVERISNAFRIMTSDENVKSVLINIFGGIVRCDRVADGIIKALSGVEFTMTVVVRLDGTNSEEAREKLKNSGLKFIIADTLEDAAKKVSKTIMN